MATIKKHVKKDGSISYCVQIRKKNFPEIYKSFPTEEEAKRWANFIEASLVHSHPAEGFYFNDMFERYEEEVLPKKSEKSFVSEKRYISYWKEKIGNQLISDVTPSEIEFHADQIMKIPSRTGIPLTAESRRKYLMCLSVMCTTAAREWKWKVTNPVQFVNKRIDLINKMKGKKNDPIDLSDVKRAFLIEFWKRANSIGLSSISSVAHRIKMPKETCRKILSEKENCTIEKLSDLCNRLGLTLKLELHEKN